MSASTNGGPDVARETDFLDLYKILGLQPGCSLDEFKYAYRRRVSVLHPDRRAQDFSKTIAADRMQQLTAMYGMAMEFQRQHGRLPGAPQARLDGQAPPTGSAQASRSATHRSSPRRLRRWLLLPAAALVVWLLWPAEPPPAPAPSSTGSTQPAATRTQLAVASPPLPLSLGMDAAAVRASEGEPTLMDDGDRWEYGPSWIRFDRGKVVDWYSSPLYPLNAATRSPPPGRN